MVYFNYLAIVNPCMYTENGWLRFHSSLRKQQRSQDLQTWSIHNVTFFSNCQMNVTTMSHRPTMVTVFSRFLEIIFFDSECLKKNKDFKFFQSTSEEFNRRRILCWFQKCTGWYDYVDFTWVMSFWRLEWTRFSKTLKNGPFWALKVT